MAKKTISAVLFLILGILVFCLDIKAQTNINFSISLNPAAITTAKPTTTITKYIYIQTSLISGNASSVSFSVSGLPSGMTLTKSPESCTPNCTPTAKISISPNVAAGKYYIKFTAKSGNITKSSDLQIVIKDPTSTTPAPAPGPITVKSISVSRAGTGSGTVKSTDGKINCGSDCSEAYSNTTSVTLNAIPSSGSTFTNWSGCTSISGTTCIVSVSGIKTVIASFNKKTTVPTTYSTKVLSPNGGETLQVGKTYNITWKTSGHNSNASVQIGLRDDRYNPNLGNGEMTIASKITNSGRFSWKIPNQLEGFDLFGSSYRIIIYISGGVKDGYYDLSDKNFTIKAESIITQSIQVTSPNGGETLQAGKTHSIVWKIENPGKVKIYFCSGTLFKTCSLIPNFPTSGVSAGAFGDAKLGEYKLYIEPKSSYIGKKLKVKIVSVENSSVYDLSDNYFTVTSANEEVKPSLQLLSPNGGEQLDEFYNYEIKWVQTGVSKVNIKLIAGGDNEPKETSYMIAFDYPTGSGKYFWYPINHFPQFNNLYRIRIYDAATNNVLDQSDSYFSIVSRGYMNLNSLDIEKSGDAYGIVKSNVGRIDCGVYCSDEFASGTVVILTAEPSEWGSSYFAGWSGHCSGTGKCTLTMDKDKVAKATFYSTGGSYMLNVTTTGTGSGKITGTGINCGSDCSETLKDGTKITLYAYADKGSKFVTWSGGFCGGNYYKCSSVVHQNIEIKAIFDKESDEELNHLTVDLLPQFKNMGKIVSEPNGIDCGNLCDISFVSGTPVKLTAIPNEGYKFGGFWGNACSGLGTSTICSFNLDTEKTIGGFFSEDYEKRNLTVVYPNGGEKLSFNKPITIKWNSTGKIKNIKEIILESSDGYNRCRIAENIPATGGRYVITLAENQLCPFGDYLKPGSYKILLTGDSESLIYGYWDESDNYFTLTGRHITSSIKANSAWSQGSRYTISWDSAGVDRISVAAVCDNNTYYRIANNILASRKSVTWRIPTNKSFVNPCKIWIGEYKGLKNQGKWSDISPAAYNQKYAETDITIIGNRSSSIMDSLYGSFLYSMLRLFPGF